MSDKAFTVSRKYCAQDPATGYFYGKRELLFWDLGFDKAVTVLYKTTTRELSWSRTQTAKYLGK